MKIMNEATILFIMELIGTVAFTISGALIAIPVVVIIRLLAAKYRWKLPKIILKN